MRLLVFLLAVLALSPMVLVATSFIGPSCAYLVYVVLLDKDMNVVTRTLSNLSLRLGSGELDNSTFYVVTAVFRPGNTSGIILEGVEWDLVVGGTVRLVNVTVAYTAPASMLTVPAVYRVDSLTVSLTSLEGRGIAVDLEAVNLTPVSPGGWPAIERLTVSLLVNETGVYTADGAGKRVGDKLPLLPLPEAFDPLHLCCILGNAAFQEACCKNFSVRGEYTYLGLNCTLTGRGPILNSTCTLPQPLLVHANPLGGVYVDIHLVEEAVRALVEGRRDVAEDLLAEAVRLGSWSSGAEGAGLSLVLEGLAPSMSVGRHSLILPVHGVDGASYVLVLMVVLGEEFVERMLLRRLAEESTAAPILGYQTLDCRSFRVWLSGGGIREITLPIAISTVFGYIVDAELWDRLYQAAAMYRPLGGIEVDLGALGEQDTSPQGSVLATAPIQTSEATGTAATTAEPRQQHGFPPLGVVVVVLLGLAALALGVLRRRGTTH